MTHSWADAWRRGYGPIERRPETVAMTEAMVERLVRRGAWPEDEDVYRVLAAADRLASAAMWLVLHMTRARQIDVTGAALSPDAFRSDPFDRMHGSLSMAAAYAGHLAANVLSGVTRLSVVGEGLCVAAVEAIHALTGDLAHPHRRRHAPTQAGLSRLVRDFCNSAARNDRRSAPLWSGRCSAGDACAGGYLGTAELQYIHMPLRGESLVAFLNAKAFEAQHGGDWAPRWWRAEDSGLAVPILLMEPGAGERGPDEKAQGQVRWLKRHLTLHGFDPLVIDGADPAAFAWAILEAGERLKRFTADPARRYPAPLPYVVAKAGAAGVLGLAGGNVPAGDGTARDAFAALADRLFVPMPELGAAVGVLRTHGLQHRPLESRHPIAARQVPPLAEPAFRAAPGAASPLAALDDCFVDLVDANPHLRPRVGDPDTLGDQDMGRTLARLKRRASRPRPGTHDAVGGGVVTAPSAEAACAAALANKGGLNLIVSYEAFAPKMLGALRAEIAAARRGREAGAPPGWVSIPLVAISDAWGEDDRAPSRRDPFVGEALLGEMSDTARVLFPIDANSAVAALRTVYRTRGTIACVVTPRRVLPRLADAAAAEDMAERGWVHLAGSPASASVQIVTVGAEQAHTGLTARARLEAHGVRTCVTAVLEPGRLRVPRDAIEAAYAISEAEVEAAFPHALPRVLISHTRPEPMSGLLRRIDGGGDRFVALGFIGCDGPDASAALFANRCSWDHAVEAAARGLDMPPGDLLTPSERAALNGRGHPRALAAILP